MLFRTLENGLGKTEIDKMSEYKLKPRELRYIDTSSD